jgi:hypothetical protein
LSKLSNFEHFVKNPILKVFLDKKSELKQTFTFIHKLFLKNDFKSLKLEKREMSQEQEQELDIKIFEFADQVKDYFQNK